MATERERARRAVLRRALDDADAAELLDMLGLADDPQDNTPSPGLARRRHGGVHTLSAATEARLAATGCTANNTPPVAPTPTPTTAVAEPTAPTRAAADRRCEGCGAPLVTQTRYKLDPDGYRARGIKQLAANNRCHACYRRQRHPAAADVPPPRQEQAPAVEPEVAQPDAVNPADTELLQQFDEQVRRAERAEQERDALQRELSRWAHALADANQQLADLHHLHGLIQPLRALLSPEGK